MESLFNSLMEEEEQRQKVTEKQKSYQDQS